MSRVRKNAHALNPPSELYTLEQVANFLGITRNALYLRLHFGNFPEPRKINGRLRFEMREILDYLSQKDEHEAFAWLVRDEIRTMIDTGQLSRLRVGELLKAAHPAVAGGGVYLRPISLEKAALLYSRLKEEGAEFHLGNDSLITQRRERTAYAQGIWEILASLEENEQLRRIAALVNRRHPAKLARQLVRHGPSWRVAKILHLGLLKERLL